MKEKEILENNLNNSILRVADPNQRYIPILCVLSKWHNIKHVVVIFSIFDIILEWARICQKNEEKKEKEVE